MINPISIQNTREQTFRGSALFHKKAPKAVIDESYKSIDKNSSDFVRECYKFFRNTHDRPVEINVETERLMDIVRSGESFVFIMNHTPKSIFDVFAAKFFNALLYREYMYQGIADKSPRSKVMANSRILEKQPDGGEKYRWMGVLPLKIGGKNKNAKTENAKIMDETAKEISENKTNLFIFPEGALLALTFLPLRCKFQPGISAVIKRVLELKDSVKVIPLGIAHTIKETAIHIGRPVEFSKRKNIYYAGSGNSDSEYFNKKLADFYAEKDEIVITENGKPVEKDRIVPYISGILSANLESCVKEAKQDLKNSSGKVFEI